MLTLGFSLIFDALSRLVVGETPAGADIVMHLVTFAGWIGLLVTALDLLPVRIENGIVKVDTDRPIRRDSFEPGQVTRS